MCFDVRIRKQDNINDTVILQFQLIGHIIYILPNVRRQIGNLKKNINIRFSCRVSPRIGTEQPHVAHGIFCINRLFEFTNNVFQMRRDHVFSFLPVFIKIIPPVYLSKLSQSPPPSLLQRNLPHINKHPIRIGMSRQLPGIQIHKIIKLIPAFFFPGDKENTVRYCTGQIRIFSSFRPFKTPFDQLPMQQFIRCYCYVIRILTIIKQI